MHATALYAVICIWILTDHHCSYVLVYYPARIFAFSSHCVAFIHIWYRWTRVYGTMFVLHHVNSWVGWISLSWSVISVLRFQSKIRFWLLPTRKPTKSRDVNCHLYNMFAIKTNWLRSGSTLDHKRAAHTVAYEQDWHKNSILAICFVLKPAFELQFQEQFQ